MMLNDMQMFIGALIGGLLGGLILILSLALVVFIGNLIDKKGQ